MNGATFNNINCTTYGDESDPGPMPIPKNAPIEGYPHRAVAIATCSILTGTLVGWMNWAAKPHGGKRQGRTGPSGAGGKRMGAGPAEATNDHVPPRGEVIPAQ